MSVVSVPKVTFDIVPAPSLVTDAPQRILFVGQKTVAGSAVDGALNKQIGVNGEENALFGQNSFLAAGIRAFRKINKLSQVDAIALDDNAGGVVAEATITIAGTATQSGEIKFSVQSVFLSTFTISVATGDTATQIAAALDAAISAQNNLILTSGAAAGVVTLTCVHKGTIGNDLIIKVDGAVAGVTSTTTAFSSGATDPVVTGVFDVVGEIRYQTVCYPSNYPLVELKTFLDNRFNVPNKVQDGVGVLSISDLLVSAYTALATTNDSPSMVIFPNKKLEINEFRGGALGELDYVVQAKVCALRTLRLTENAPVSQFVAGSTLNARTTGGIQFASIPYQNTPVPDSSIVPTDKWWTDAEQTTLNDSGIAMIGNNPTENAIILGEVVTTFLTASGFPSTIFKFLNAVDGASAAREFFVNNNRAQYAQTVLTAGDIVPNTPMANEAIIKTFQIGLYDDLGQLGVVQVGTQADKFFRDNLTVTINFNTGDVAISALLPLVIGLRSITAVLQITFNTNG